MGRAGDSKTFLAVAAALMAGLVIATMLAINAKLRSALAPAAEQAGAPAIKMVPPVAAPLLQSTAAPSVANSQPNSGSNSFSHSVPTAPHAATPKRQTAGPAPRKPPVAIGSAPTNATQPAPPPAPPPVAPAAGTQPPSTPTPAVPVPVATVVGPPPAIPPAPNLSAVATATVTVVPEPDLGDSVASSGETHRGQRRDRDGDSVHPDLTATPTGPDAEANPWIRPEGEEGDDDGAGTAPGNKKTGPELEPDRSPSAEGPQFESMAVGSSLPSR